MSKVVVAYSGTLDTTICVYYLRVVKGMKVFTFSANIGQFDLLEPLVARAMDLGVTAAHVADLRERFAREFIFPCVRARAVYEGQYHLLSALARPLIIEELVNIAREEDCEFIAHGSRGIGNDAVRFDNCIRYLAPDLKVIAPLQELGLRTTQDDLAYAKQHSIKYEQVKKALYNVEENLWGVNIQLRGTDHNWTVPPRDTYILTTPLEQAPSKGSIVSVTFESGIPKKLNGEELPPVQIIQQLNRLGGRHAIGRHDMIETRISGVKSREIYETPAADILHAALGALEAAILDKETLHFKNPLSEKYADLVYEGKWFSPMRIGIDSFFEKISKNITGTVTMSLMRGKVNIIKVGSEYSQL